VDMYLGVLQDIWLAVSPLIFSKKWQEEKDAVLNKIKPMLINLNKQMKEQWSINYLTVVDFRLADLISVVCAIFPELTEQMKNMLDIR
jgi:hypothetical protein